MLKPGGYSFQGLEMRYSKPALTISDQAQLLLDRGLICDDRQRLEHYLSNIGYYRLSAYLLPFEQASINGNSRNHKFLPGTTFEQVLNLYVFDRKLRMLVMEAIERIEVAARTRWASAMALSHGSHAHMISDLFKNPWQHATDIARVAKELQDSNETFVVHYRKKYEAPYLPPIWAVVETMTLGGLSRWIASTNDNQVKREVAKALGMPTIEILEQVLHALTPMRNICAHHARLWNRRFILLLPNIKRLRGQFVTETIVTTTRQTQESLTREIYNFLVVIQYLMLQINPGTSWGARLVQHIQPLLAEQQQAMGFPVGWETRQPWAGKA
jgi:abortive infection bacteriophage resistance protein